ncbi:hypothetical protein F511_42453 [Dorcoceras hygrometricum]|uniref:CCHC-type domain-containing protein n=2 Tax=Dorcoceras hygrometricum TaxID=472368 RepID=A0A2Z7AT96_9LAMI|nr:hypothetical protein F511_42453 [Dorcoceras hygrometricum]
MAKRGGKGKEIVQESHVEIPKGKRGRPPGGVSPTVDADVEQLRQRVHEMEFVVARFQDMQPPKFFGNEGSERAEGWLKHMEFLFDTVYYDPERRLKMAVLQLRDRAQRWWESVTNVLNQSGKDITWDVFRAKFTQEFAPPSYISAKESEFYRLVQGNMTVREYAQQFSALLTYVPHIASSEKGKLKKFLEGLNYHLRPFVLSGSPLTYAEAVEKAIEIDLGLRHDPTPPISGGPYGPMSIPYYPPQQPSQQPYMRPQKSKFRPKGKFFKKKGQSSSSSSSSEAQSGTGGQYPMMFCERCGGRHPTAQCFGVPGYCNRCGQQGHYARVCPSRGQGQMRPPQYPYTGGSFQGGPSQRPFTIF